jgi:hypothetical protein
MVWRPRLWALAILKGAAIGEDFVEALGDGGMASNHKMVLLIGFPLTLPRFLLVSLVNAETMPATLSRDKVWSLWSRVDGKWHHMATDNDESRLRFKAESLRRLFTNRQFIVVPGASMPR